MMLIAGTVPIKDMPLTFGTVRAEGDYLLVDGYCIPCTQGTGAMVSAALTTTEYLKLEAPQILVAGDIGQGKGSRGPWGAAPRQVVCQSTQHAYKECRDSRHRRY